ncbi:MAG: NDP-sugar synthase [Actinobacteria bacterium]|nr:NDP-sugar synthase [Actinomycetota bacterium]
MKALILAGGMGTRLRPLTNTRPKHLLPIANRPHIEHVFDLLQRHGVDEVVLLTSYLAEAFETTVGQAASRGLAVHVTHEEEPLGTAGALRNAEEFASDGTFLVFNGDVLMDIDLGEVLEFHRDRGAEATIVLTPVDDPSAYGVVPTEQGGRVLGFIEKPPRDEATTNLINAGIYVLEPSVLERIPRGEVWSAERQLFPGLVEEGARLFAVAAESYWMDIGTPEKFLQANLDALSGRYRDAQLPELTGGSLIGEGAKIDGDAQVSSASIGEDAEIEAGAVVEESVLMPRAVVEAGAIVRRSILGEASIASKDATLIGITLEDNTKT